MDDELDKRRIYQLINLFLSGKIDDVAFCYEFYYSLDLELKQGTLTEEERAAFLELGEVAGRFLEYQADFKNYPGAFGTIGELRQKIAETKEKLKKNFEKFKDLGDEDLID